MTDQARSQGLEPRPPLTWRATRGVWLLWALGAALLTVSPLLWHLGYFDKTGPYIGSGIVAVLVALSAFAWGYRRFWPGALRGLELRLFLGAFLAATAVQEPLATLVTLAVAAACYMAGAAGLAKLGVESRSPLERIALATGTGLGLCALVLIPLGLAGLYRPGIFWLLLAAALVVFRSRLPGLWRDLCFLDAGWETAAHEDSPLVGVVVAFLPAFAAAFWMAAMAPATATDPIAFHMPAVKHYLQSGELSPLPVLEGAYQGGRWLFSLGHSAAYSYYPQSFELLQTLAWGLGGQAAAQMISPLFAILAALTAGAIGRRCGLSSLAAIVGMAAAFAIPVVSWSGAIAKNDSMLAYFELAALFTVITAREHAARRRLLLGAFFLGLCFGTKHVALFGAIPISFLMLGRLRELRAPWRLALGMAAVFAAAGLTWHARTWLATGNPLFPADVAFAGKAMPAIGGRTATPWLDRLTYPWVAHFRGRLTNEGPSDNPLGFFFVFFGAGWALLRRRQRSAAERDCLIFCAVYAAYWIYSWGVLRYGIPLLLILAMLTAHRVEGLARASSRWVRRGVAVALAYCFAFALLPALMLEVNVHQLRYFARRIDRTGYVRAMLKEYPSIEYLNSHLTGREWALAIDNCALAYANDPLRFRCMELRGAMSRERVEDVIDVVRDNAPDFLVLPADETGDLLLPPARAAGYRQAIFEDASYRVLRRRTGE